MREDQYEIAIMVQVRDDGGLVRGVLVKIEANRFDRNVGS